MSHKPLIQYLRQIVDRAQNGADMDGTKRKVVKAIHHYKPMPDRVESLLRRAKCTIRKDYAIACLIEAQSVLMCIDLDAQSVSGTGGIYGSANTNTLTTVAVGDILATEMRTCYPDLLKKVEALTRYDIFDVYAPSSEIDEVDDGKYLKREDVIRLLGGDA